MMKYIKKIKGYIQNGWPKNQKLVDKEIIPYFKVKEKLKIVDNLILKGDQILIPSMLRRKILNILHEGHMGIQRCRNLARQTVYWPNIYNDIANIVNNCEICLKFRNSNPKMEMIPHEIYNTPWFKVGSDMFEFNKRQYLIVVDYFTKYFEIELLEHGYSSANVIMKFKSIFARHGIPQILITDNGPPYSSKDFNKFCLEWGIEHRTSSPYLPRSNGLAERTIQTFKKMFYKCKECGSDPYIALLIHRTTPKDNMPSPAQLLMSRTLRTKLPTFSENFRPKLVDTVDYGEQLRTRTMKSVEHYNKNAVRKKPIKIGDAIMFKRNNNSWWFPGEVVEECQEPRSFLVKDDEGVLYRRNQQHMSLKPEPLTSPNSDNSTPNSNVTEHIDNSSQNSDANYYTDNNQDHYRTRSGRKVVKPSRFDSDVKNK